MTATETLERRTRNWKTGPAELRTDSGGDTLTGYAAVFNRYSQDMGGWVEQIAPGAFAKTISESVTDQRDIFGLFNHNPDAILGLNSAGTLHMIEDEIGLRYEINLDNDHWGNTVRSKVARGELRGSSFGFSVIPDAVSWGLTEQGMPLRSVRAAKLFDVGPVTYPAYLPTRDDGAAVALRSLAASTGVDVAELLDAAGRHELRSYISPDTSAVTPEPAQHATPIAVARRRLELNRLLVAPGR